MKTILIATDFSKASRHASLYGAQLAKAMNANIILFTAYRVSHDVASLNVQISHYDVMQQTEIKLRDEADIIANGERLRIEVICEEGLPEKSILAVAAEKEADLIIVGMTGGGNNIKKLFGGTTTSLIKDLTVPVLIIPEKALFSQPKTILYASDAFLDITLQPIDEIQWITDFFTSKLYVVRIVNDDYEKLLEEVNVPHRLRAGLKKINTTFQFPVNKNISNGLTDFIKTQPVDMLIMRPHKHEWIERLFIKSETKDMVFHTHVPLLVLPGMTNKKTRQLAPVTAENVSSL